MTAPTNLSTSLTSVGNKEDLEDVIYRVAPEDAPFTANIGTAKANTVKHDWQTEGLASPNAANAALEGDDIATLDASNLTTRLENVCQIFRKTGGVSETQDAVISAGRDDEMDRQKVLKGIELKRDIEARMIGNYASNAESGGTARGAAGAMAWGVTNTSVGAGGSNGGYSGGVVAAATNGTARSFTEALVKAGMAPAFSNGGKPSQAYMGAVQKQEWSAFTGIAQIRKESPGSAKMATIVGAADLYVSDFGVITLIPHPYGLSRDCIIVDPSMWAVATLRGMQARPLAKTGDSDRFIITKEATLVARNEKSSVFIRDLQ
jgi:uncharacterized protein DUF5309